MKTKTLLTTTILSIFLAATYVGQPAQAAGGGAGKGRQAVTLDGSGSGSTAKTASSSKLSSEDEAQLLFMREEEKLARDVYRAMYALWQSRVFDNIAASEQQHMDTILGLLEKYDLPDPAGDEGVFQNVELQALYDDLVARGSKSLLDALTVGALIEEVDIEDLVQSIDTTTRTDLSNVYSNLLSASEQHLRAFAGNIEMITGESYTAQLLDDATVETILADSSKGSRMGKGKGRPQGGKGKGPRGGKGRGRR